MTVRAQQATKRRYGLPFSGLHDAMDKHEAPLSAMGADSREMLCEPGRVQGLSKIKRRHGAAGVGSATGVLEMVVADATMRGLDTFELPTGTSADGFPVLACMFADESKRFAQLWLRDGSTDYTELEEFGSTHYPTSASTQGNIKMPALPYDGNGATGYTRGAFEENRRRIVAGSRRSVGIKNRHYSPSFYGTPSGWDRSYNLTTGAGSNNHVRYPTGHIMPCWAPNFPAASYPTRKSTAAPWAEGDKFFAAVAFEWEDGTISMPFIPRDINATLTAGLGLITVDDDGDATAEYFDYIPWRDIAIGPPGVKRRHLMRTNKISKTAAAAGAWPDLSTLKTCAIIEDNVSTRYDDPRGNDTALFTNPLTRTDQVWPSRARYGAAFDSHHIIGYLRPNPCALVICPTATPGGTSRGINAGYDDAALVGATAMMFQLRQDNAGAKTLRLRATAFGAAVPATTTIALGSGTTLQSLCDSINATTPASTGGEWCAQLVPGANPNADVTNLAPTHLDIPNCQWLNGAVSMTVTDPSSIAEGMKVNDAKWPAGTYVKSKSGTTVNMSAASTAASGGAVDCEFYADTGDDALFTDATAHSQYGNYRCYGNAYPGIIGFTQAYLDTFPTEKRDFMVTSAGPTQKPNAAHMFHTSPGGRYQGESEAGIYMGAAPLGRGCVVFYSNRIGYYSNQRSGGTGEDADFRMEWIDLAHGCRSPYSIVHGNRWVGCWRDDGFWVYDGEKSAILTGAIFDPTTGKGLLTYEAGLCNAAAAADTNDFYMHAHYRDGRLWVNFRTDSTHWANACYDCSPGIEAAGLAQVLDVDGNPYGWSSRLRYSWRSLNAGCGGSIGSVRTSSGVKLYQADDKNDKTNCGLMQEFETTGTWVDGADAVQWILYTTGDMAGALKKFSLSGLITMLYRLVTAGASLTCLAVVYRNQQRTAVSSLLLPVTSGDTFTRKAFSAPLASRSPGEVVEIAISGGSENDAQAAEFSGIEVDVEVLDSLT